MEAVAFCLSLTSDSFSRRLKSYKQNKTHFNSFSSLGFKLAY